MTEIPEHLLKRSRERRQAAGLGGGEAASTPAKAEPSASAPATAASTPAPRAAAAPIVPATPPPPPVPPYVQAANRRKKIPFWAMPVLALLPVWLFMYMKAMQPQKKKVEGPLAAGATVYAKCASCHGSTGEGGVGYQLSNGEVLKSFPKIEDQLSFVYTGNKPWVGKPYGSGRHVGGAKGPGGAMPAWGPTAGGELTDLQILEVVCHERYDLGGGDQASEEFTTWCTAGGTKYEQVVSGGFAAAGVNTTGPS